MRKSATFCRDRHFEFDRKSIVLQVMAQRLLSATESIMSVTVNRAVLPKS